MDICVSPGGVFSRDIKPSSLSVGSIPTIYIYHNAIKHLIKKVMKTKKEIIKEVQSQHEHLTLQETKEIIEDFISEIQDSIIKGEKIKIAGLGIFHPKTIKARMGINPQDPKEKILQPPRRSVRFALDNGIKKIIN